MTKWMKIMDNSAQKIFFFFSMVNYKKFKHTHTHKTPKKVDSIPTGQKAFNIYAINNQDS